MIEWRRILAGGIVAVCVLGLTVSADASGARQGRHDRRGTVTGQETPDYGGRTPGDHPKLDRKLNERARTGGLGRTRAIIVLKPSCSVDSEIAKVGGRKGRRLNLISGALVELPNGVLKRLADNPCVASIHWDRKIGGEMNRAAVTLGARAIQQQLGFDGAGVGVAIIDSGITAWHDDLTYHGSNPAVQVVNGQRVTKFVDFVNGNTNRYDDNGHGSHVAGIVAGNGWDTLGARAGIAPAADIVSLKVLNAQGSGYISDVIAALDWVVANKTTYNIRVVNLSVGGAVTESYMTDPLTVAAKRVVDAGVVVVSAAGNNGKRNGQTVYGGITSPGNAPWVLTVGADSHQGTVTRTDDVMADYSSHGPTAFDYQAKPDVVAPGTGIVSLSVVGSLLYTTHPANLLGGSLLLGQKPYLSLTGTSMAAPMVTGTIALMMQANPTLTPNLAKAIIQYTAQDYGYNPLVQGTGFLNTEGAVKLASYLYTAQPGSAYPYNPAWSRTLIWGTHKLKGGVITPRGNAYGLNVVWGTADDESNIVWGTLCPDQNCDNTVWAAADDSNIVWGTADDSNIVWGTENKPPECLVENPPEWCNIVWGTTADDSNIVWGTDCGGDDCAAPAVWGTACDSAPNCQGLWGTLDDDGNIVWGTSDDDGNIVWGTSDDDGNIVWGTSDIDTPPIYDDPDAPSVFDNVPFETLFFPPVPPTAPPPPAGGSTTTGGGGL